MDNKSKLVRTVIVTALVIVSALFLYRTLSSGYAPEKANDNDTKDLPEAASFVMLDDAGSEVRLEDMTDKPVILNFWASWCPPCREEMPHFEKMYKKYGYRVNFIMLDQPDGQRETMESGRKFVESNGYSFPLYFDTAFEGATAYNISGYPTTVAITAGGKVYSQHTGMITEDGLEEMIEGITKG